MFSSTPVQRAGGREPLGKGGGRWPFELWVSRLPWLVGVGQTGLGVGLWLAPGSGFGAAFVAGLGVLQVGMAMLPLPPRWFWGCSAGSIGLLGLAACRPLAVGGWGEAFGAFVVALTLSFVLFGGQRRESARLEQEGAGQAGCPEQEAVVALGRLVVAETATDRVLGAVAGRLVQVLGATWVALEQPNGRVSPVYGGRGGSGVVWRVPLLAEGRASSYGALCVQLPEGVAEERRGFVEAVANWLALALRREALEEQRRRSELALQEAQRMRALSVLAGGVAHDFNNLLTVVIGHAEALQDWEGLSPQTREMLGEILRAGESAADLTQQLLTMNRSQKQDFEVFDLNEVVRGLQGMMRRTIPENIALSTGLCAEPCSVFSNPSQIEYLVTTLMLNAREALAAEGLIEVSTRIARVDETAVGYDGLPVGCYVVLEVRDNGRAIPRELLPHLFEPFGRAPSGEQGMGLGLSAVRSIVAQAGGWIRVKSEPGMGSSFKVYLPFAQEAAPSAEAESVSSGVFGRAGAHVILLVEDDAALRSLLSRTLEAEGHRVVNAGSSAEAIALSETLGPVSLLLCDAVMPLLSGRHVVAHICERRPDLRVLWLSGSAAATRMASDGAEVIRKPFTATELCYRVRRLLAAGPVLSTQGEARG